jgi:drug/metabolite transporter superfamily protein YnfA
MIRIVLIVVGVIVALFGTLFALQGFGFVHGSPMTGTTTWSLLGPLIALVGVAIAIVGWRKA